MKQQSIGKRIMNSDDSISTQVRQFQRFSRSRKANPSQSPSSLSDSLSLSKFYVKNTFKMTNKPQQKQQGPIKRFKQKLNLQYFAKKKDNNEQNVEQNKKINDMNILPIFTIEEMLSQYGSLKKTLVQYLQSSEKQSMELLNLQQNNSFLIEKVQKLTQLINTSQKQKKILIEEIRSLKQKQIKHQSQPLKEIQAQSQNSIDKVKNSVLRSRNVQLQIQKKQLENSVLQLKQSLRRLKDHQNNHKFIQECLTHTQTQLFTAQQQIKRLHLQINILKRKKHLQFEMILKLKQKQNSQIKYKYSQAMNTLKQTKKMYINCISKLRKFQANQTKKSQSTNNSNNDQNFNSYQISILSLSQQSFSEQ